MQKSEAIKLFGNINQMAEALGVSRQSIHRWNNCLTQSQEDRVRGAYMRIAEERDRLLTHSVNRYE